MPLTLHGSRADRSLDSIHGSVTTLYQVLNNVSQHQMVNVVLSDL
jgi:hypothetical protein